MSTVWLVPAFPLAGALLNIFFGRLTGRRAHWIAVPALAGSFLASCAVAGRAWSSGASSTTLFTWIVAGDFVTGVTAYVDSLTAVMLLVVTGVGFLIHLYSAGYMHDDPGYARYFAYLNLFVFSMTMLVLAGNFLLLYVFWEAVGLCSYLLIGFWYTRPAAAEAGKKAFIVNRVGDFGFGLGIMWLWVALGTLDFVAGIVMLWSATGTFDFWTLFRMGSMGTLPLEALPPIMFLIYLGAVGKSAQFPLHVWLPDAMEGPTPVSALIHAATMVTAGVFLVTRAFPLFRLAPDVLTLMAWVGAGTALLAASMACVENDIKRVLAYSTISQLGLMFLAMGVGAFAAGIFHLYTHAFFKALLFLGAGIVIHVFHTNDVFRMGGLRSQPRLWLPFLIATLALAGVWPLPGFFTKEAILAGTLEGRAWGPFVLLALTAFLTAFYMFRVVFLTFFARPHHAGHAHHHVPAAMEGVCWLLAALTLAMGLKQAMQSIVGGHHEAGPTWLPAFSLTLAGAGIVLAWAMYQRALLDPARVAAVLRPLDWMARRRYGLDAIFAGLYRGILLGVARLVGWIDRYLVDGVLNVLSAWTLRAGDRLRALQSGQPQDYVYGVALGALLLFVLAQWRRW